MTTLERTRRLIETSLEAAWLRRCGNEDVPGEWSPAEYVEVMEGWGVELQFVPTFLKERNGTRMWSRHFTSGDPWWEWRIMVDADDLTEDEVERLGPESIERVDAVDRRRHVVALADQAPREHVPIHLVVVDDEDAGWLRIRAHGYVVSASSVPAAARAGPRAASPWPAGPARSPTPSAAAISRLR